MTVTLSITRSDGPLLQWWNNACGWTTQAHTQR